jgi:DNA polymerase IV
MGRVVRQRARTKNVGFNVKTKGISSSPPSLTVARPVSFCEELAIVALTPGRRVELGPAQLFRLVGVGLDFFKG